MNIKAQILGSVRDAVDQKSKDTAKIVTDAIKAQTDILKNNWRAQIRGAGLSSRLANTVRSKVFPRSGNSMRAAGEVWIQPGTPQKILSELEEGAVITVARGRFLAVPTENVPKGPKGSRLTPHALEALTGYHLRFAQNRRGTKMLVADTVASRSKRGGIRPATKGRVRQGRQVTSTVFYILVPQVTLKKRLNLMAEAERIGGELAGLIAERIN